MRKRLWQLHSWCGLLAGLGLLVIGMSGSILVFRREVDSLLAGRSARLDSAPAVQAKRLDFDTLFARVRAQMPDLEIAGWQVATRRDQPDEVALVKRGEASPSWHWLDANPYTGEVLGAKPTGRTFTEWLLDLHVSFLMGDWGTVVVGLFAVLLCLLGVSGAWMYRRFWVSLFRLRWRASARIFSSDLHKAVGISSVAFNLVLGFTGAWWNLSSLPDLLSATPPAPTAQSAASLYNAGLSIDGLIAKARKAVPDLRADRVYLNFPPRWENISVQGQTPTSNPFRSDFGAEVLFDRQTGALKKVTDIRQQGIWTQIKDTFGPLHFGTFGGLPIKLAWCLGGLAPGILAVSGFVIWHARRRPRPAMKALDSRRN